MGLGPSEFWSLTPHEFNTLAEAYHEKREAEIRLTRYFVAHLMWAAGVGNWKHGISVRTFLNGFEGKSEGEELSRMQRLHQKFVEEQMNGNLE